MWEFLRMLTRRRIKKEIIINAESLETRVAILEEGKLEDYFIERKGEDRIVGSIFKGRIQNLEDGLQAAFVDIGLKKNAFIHYWDMIPEDTARLEAEEGIDSIAGPPSGRSSSPGEMARMFPVGSDIVVQVTKGAIGTKGPRVTANLSVPGRYLVMMPGTTLKGVSKQDRGRQGARSPEEGAGPPAVPRRQRPHRAHRRRGRPQGVLRARPARAGRNLGGRSRRACARSPPPAACTRSPTWSSAWCATP
jgi:Ribonuclease G/E